MIVMALALLASGCAKQGYPSGGPKDTQPPQCKAAKPQNETRNFRDKEFFIEFDEYVMLKDANNNVLISPPMRQKPEFTTKGKGVLVKLNDTLLDNTTYLFQFKEAIADYTEGNVLPTYEYVFSTGDAMDTMMVGGTVLNARNGKPWKETLTVMAYADSHCGDDTIATHLQPNYVTRTDKEGRFAFHYIPAGSYRLVAVEDKNRDLRVANGEAVAWLDSPAAAVDSIDSSRMVQMRISVPDNNVQRVVKSEFTAPGRAMVNTLLPMSNPKMEGEPLEWRLNAGRDTMQVWFLDEKCDSARFVLSDEGLQDTLKLRYRKPKRPKSSASQQQPKVPLIKPLCSGNSAFYDDLRIAFTVPVKEMRQEASAEVMRLKDSTVSHCGIVLDSGGMQARLNTSLHSDEQYRVKLRDSLFADIYGHWSDSLVINLTPKDYGILNIIVTGADTPLVVEVLDSRDTVVQQKTLPIGGGTLRFIHLPVGEYRLRAVLDTDGNGHWTPGDYRAGCQPEESVIFEKPLKLREKWEMEERWNISDGK